MKILGWGKSNFGFSLWKTWKKPKLLFPQPDIIFLKQNCISDCAIYLEN